MHGEEKRTSLAPLHAAISWATVERKRLASFLELQINWNCARHFEKHGRGYLAIVFMMVHGKR